MKYGKCFLCGEYGELETHHIFRCVGGASRTKSDRLGLTVDLCRWCHQESPRSAHRCAETDRQLKRYGQKKAMLEQGWDKNTFIREFGRNYLDADDLEVVEALQEEGTGDGTREEPEPIEWQKDAPAGPVTVRGEGFRVTVEVMPF